MTYPKNFTIEKNGKDIVVHGLPCFQADLILDCGQAFRWNRIPDGSWSGMAECHPLTLYQEKDARPGSPASVRFCGISAEEFTDFWAPYFDLSRDYDAVLGTLAADKNMRSAADEFYGIRILKQDPWEATLSFIISQNNNIPRIKGIVEKLCCTFGTQADEQHFAFPTPAQLASLTEDDLQPLRAGYRASYIIDAARKVDSGDIDLDSICALPLEEAEEEIRRIKGVGPKVAQCALLYGFAQMNAFPRDVWVKRIMKELYPDGLPDCMDGIRGIAQQYLFHWRRNSEITEFGE